MMTFFRRIDMKLLIRITTPVIIAIVTSWLFQPAILHFKRQSNPKPQVTLHYVNDGSIRSESIQSIVLPESRYNASIVIPAFNEEKRLPRMFESTLDVLSSWPGLSFEVIVVDDGSTDHTTEAVKALMIRHPLASIKLIQVKQNQGKGGAVKIGVEHSQGDYILMTDADGATDIRALSDLYRLVNPMHGSSTTKTSTTDMRNAFDIAIGSRAHMAINSVKARAWYRTILMYGFHILVKLFCTRHIKDTQCGFKLFSRKAAKAIFSQLHLNGWAFDIELIYVAEQLNYSIAEVPVEWHEVEGSKLIRTRFDVVTTSLSMARDIICVRLCYLLGIWRITIE